MEEGIRITVKGKVILRNARISYMPKQVYTYSTSGNRLIINLNSKDTDLEFELFKKGKKIEYNTKIETNDERKHDLIRSGFSSKLMGVSLVLLNIIS